MQPTLSCPRCNGSLDPGARFCQSCGLSLSGDQPLVTGAAGGTGTGAFQLAPAQVDLLVQATLGEYDILGELGQGGMATVYLAHDIALNRKVAIKLMSPAYLHGPDMVARFKREARTAAALSHPHIIPVYAVREEEQVLFFVMKYVKGRTLDSIIHEMGPVPLTMVRSILLEVTGALDYAHREGVVHRDIKPGNIMVDEEGFVMVTDFGIAKAMQGETLTITGTTVGTPSYLSPEACTGGPVNQAADQYSLGAVAYEMVTGKPPFEAENSMAMMYAQVHAEPRPSTQIRSDCPPELNEVIMRMLAKNPAERFPSMHDVAAAIGLALPSAGDGVRTQIGLLARNRPTVPVEANRLTPTSWPAARPISGGRARAITPAAAAAPTLPLPRKQNRLLLSIGAAILGVLALLLLRPRSQPAPVLAPAPATISSTDSLWIHTRGAAEFARQRAVAAGVPAKALAGADSLFQQALTEAAADRKAEAAVLVTKASGIFADAEKAALAKAPTPSTPATAAKPKETLKPTVTAPAAAPAPEPVAAKPVPSESLAIAEYYSELKRAIDSRQLAEIKRLLPNLSGKEEGQWRKLFEDRKVTGIESSFFVREVQADGDQGQAHVIYDLTVTKDGKSNMKQQDQKVLLSRGPHGWRQIRVDEQN
jgi:serine/threonine protein kinase